VAALDLELHEQQSAAFLSHATEILYGGAAGGGKSHLIRVLAITVAYEVAGVQVYLFRRLSDDLYKNHMEGAGGFFALLLPWIETGHVSYNGSKNYIKFWNGSKIWLSHCQHEKDKFKYQGAEIHLLLIDELTHFSESIYRFLRGRTRLGELALPEKYIGKLPLVLSGSNPGGVGHNWVKRSFVDRSAPMAIERMGRDDGGMLRQFIPALLTDNPTLTESDPDYADRLGGLGDPALVKAMLSGDWNIVSGGALDDVWGGHLILEPFNIPSQWRVDRSFDWGSSHPFSVGWWVEADGSEVELADGDTFCPPAGSLIRIAEWYGSDGIGCNKGLKLSPTDIAVGIKEREAEMISSELIQSPPLAGPADNQISQTTRSDVATIADSMAEHGIYWTQSDKSAGSRIGGLELLRSRMRESGKDHPEQPAIYFFSSCMAAISTLPTLPRDKRKPDDVDTNSEDHVYDEIRYRVLSTRRAVMNIELGMAF